MIDSLSKRERQVIRLLRAGKRYKEIGALLRPQISENSVRTHIARAYEKLGISSRYDLPRV